MSYKNTDLSNGEKILNSDIYDLTEFVDNIKKINIIDGIDDTDTKQQETLLVGMYGYLGYEFTSLLQNSIVVASELANEAIPTRAKFDKNVITHALSLGIRKVAATPASMKVLLLFPERALRNNMIDNKFTFKSSIPIRFGNYEFHTDYDINIYSTELKSSTNGTATEYVYTAHYDMTNINPISDIDNEYLPPLSIFADDTDNMILLITSLHQVEYIEYEQKIIGNDDITNKTFNFTFDNQMSYFTVEVTETSMDGLNNTISLIPVYDGLYNQEANKYCYYQYINSNTIRIRFDPNSYQPRTNATVKIKVWTTQGSNGNFEYYDDLMVRLTSDNYTNLYMIVKQRGEDGSFGGLDRKTTEELQKIIPKEALSRGSITTLNDLKNYFNSINNETSVLHVFRKEDNILTRIYYTYYLMKDNNYNVIPTNTASIYIKNLEKYNGKMYLESGTPIYLFKNKNSKLPILNNNFIGYKTQDEIINNIMYTWNDLSDNFLTTNDKHYELDLYLNIHFKLYSETGNDRWANNWYDGYIFKRTVNTYSKYSEKLGKVVEYKYWVLSVKVEDTENVFNSSYEYCNIELIVPNSITALTDVADLSRPDKCVAPLGPNQYILTNIKPVKQYSFQNSVKENDFDSLILSEGDNIEFCTYNSKHLWDFGEVLSITRKNNRIIGINILVHDQKNNTFNPFNYRIPTSIDADSSLGNKLKNTDIVSIKKVSNFTYCSPLSIVLKDDSNSDSNRVNASYYLDNINEERYLSFKCINSKSPLQYIASYVKVLRPSYLSTDRYNYTITINLIPNIGNITDDMINRTKVVVVFYRDNIPAVYSIADYVTETNDYTSMTYQVKLFTKPLSNDIIDDNESTPIDTIDDNNRLYIGNGYLNMTGYSSDDYKLYQVTGDAGKERLSLDSFYLDTNVNMRIYTLYKYDDDIDINEYHDDLSKQFRIKNTQYNDSGVALLNIIPKTTSFPDPVIDNDAVSSNYEEYSIGDMVLTNVYETQNGINLLYDYSNLMNSYVSMINYHDPHDRNDHTNDEIGYIINRVPMVRYFYFNSEDRINTFIKELKRKILYVLDALDPLECTFGLDFKFFNTYGPSNMYHITNIDGNISDLINNVALTITFRAKFYNENSSKDSVLPLIKNDIKEYLENLEDLSDVHYPNLTTMIESKYSDHIIYFEYINFNIYDANHQHIITNENMEMLTTVPEFLNIDTDDYTGLPRININIVT